MKATKVFSILILIFTLTLTSTFGAGCAAQGMGKGEVAPDFKLMNLKGEEISLSSFRGNKAVLLVFWATRCYVCREEIPTLKKIYSKYQPQGLEILAVSIMESKEKLSSFAKQNNLSYPILMDLEGKAASLYQVVGIPTNVIIDKQGAIQFKGNALPLDYEVILDKVVK